MNKNSTILLNSGNEIPVMGIGTWHLQENTAETIAYAIDIGYRLIDTSSDYGTQSGVGEGIRLSSINRDSLFIVTKVEETDDAYTATKKYLKEMDLSYANLMLIHRPPLTGVGDELWEGLIRAQKEGLTRDIGVSNYSIELMDELIDKTGVIPAVNQIEWNPFGYSREMREYCDIKDIVIEAYSPLTRGKRLHDEKLIPLAYKYGKSPAQIIIRWNLQEGIVPIPKANQKRHIEENNDVFDFELTEEDITFLNNLNERYSTQGSLAYI